MRRSQYREGWEQYCSKVHEGLTALMLAADHAFSVVRVNDVARALDSTPAAAYLPDCRQSAAAAGAVARRAQDT